MENQETVMEKSGHEGKDCKVCGDPVISISDGRVCHFSFVLMFSIACDTGYDIRDWSLIMGRGATKWENRGSETVCAPPPPPQDRAKLFRPLPLLNFKEWKLFAPPPPTFNIA